MMKSQSPPAVVRVLIVEDEEGFAQALKRNLGMEARERGQRFAIETRTKMAPLEAMKAWAGAIATQFDVVLLDQRLNSIDGLDLIEDFRQNNPNLAVIVLTGYNTPEDGVRARQAGAWDYLIKPVETEELILAIDKALEWQRTRSERQWLEILHRFSMHVQGLDDPQQVAEAIVDAAAELGFIHPRLWRLEEVNGRRMLRGWAQRGLEIEPDAFHRFAFDVEETTYSKQTLAQKEPVIYKGREKGPGRMDDLLKQYGELPPEGLWVDIPLWAGDECLGKLRLEGKVKTLTYDREEWSLLGLLSQQASAALARALAEKERKKREAEAKETAHALALLHRMSRELPSLMTQDEEKGWLATLTALTADYGLRCNRALLFGIQSNAQGKVAQGVAAVGEMDEKTARRAWEREVEIGRTLDDYVLALRRDEIKPTPAHELVKKLTIPIGADEADPFHRLLTEKKPLRLQGKAWRKLPKAYRDHFAATETVLIPAFLDERVVGILAVDNFADKKPISEQTVRHLQSFVDQSWLILREVRERKRLQGLLDVSKMLSRSATRRSLGSVLDAVCKSACQITGADLATIYPFVPAANRYDTKNVGRHGHIDYRPPKSRPRTRGVSRYLIEHGWLEVENIDTAAPLPGARSWKTHPFLKREGVKAILAARLNVGDDVVGLLFLNWRHPHLFERGEREAVRLLATLAANAIHGAQQFTQLTKNLDEQRRQRLVQAEELEQIRRIEEAALRIEVKPEEVVRAILYAMSEAMPLSRTYDFHLAILELAPNKRMNIYKLDDHGGIVCTPRPSDEGIIGHVIQSGKGFRIDDVRQRPWRDRYIGRPEMRSELCIPLKIENRVLGALNVESDRIGFFEDEHERALRRLGAAATLALQRVEQQADLERLIEVAKALTLPTTLEETFKTIRQQLSKTAPDLDAFTIWYTERDAGALRLGAHYGLKYPDQITQPLVIGEVDSPVTRMLARREPIWPKDARRTKTLAGSFIRREGIRSCAAIPLHVENESVGVMFLNYRRVHTFSQREKHLFKLFGEFVATALYEEMLREEATRSTSLALMSAVGTELYHDVSNIVSPITIQAHLLESETLSREGEEAVSIILEQLERLSELSRLPPLPDPNKPRSYDVQNSASLHRVIQETAQEVIRQFNAGGSNYELHVRFCQEQPLVCIHPRWLSRIIRHLATNALQAMPEGGALRIETRTSDGNAIVRVIDEGVGFPRDILFRVFRERIDPDTARGKGQGLLQTALVVKAHRGSIEVEWTKPHKGSCIRIALPLSTPQTEEHGGGP